MSASGRLRRRIPLCGADVFEIEHRAYSSRISGITDLEPRGQA
jgi:hypothetical protein